MLYLHDLNLDSPIEKMILGLLKRDYKDYVITFSYGSRNNPGIWMGTSENAKKLMANFCEFPGNCSWTIAHGFFIMGRNLPIAFKATFLNILGDISAYLGYNRLLVSHTSDNDWIKAFEQADFEKIMENPNHHSGSNVCLYAKNLEDYEKLSEWDLE